MVVKVSSKGAIVIPVNLRQKYNLKPGDRVRVVDSEGVLWLVPVSAHAVRRAAGMLMGQGSLTKAILDEHRKERRSGR